MPGGPRWKPDAIEREVAALFRTEINERGRGEQARICRLTGIADGQLPRYLRGDRSMLIAEFEAICGALGWSPAETLAQAEAATKIAEVAHLDDVRDRNRGDHDPQQRAAYREPDIPIDDE